MLDIPLNKALAAVESNGDCSRCCFVDNKSCLVNQEFQTVLACFRTEREDGENVIFKLVDLPGEENHG